MERRVEPSYVLANLGTMHTVTTTLKVGEGNTESVRQLLRRFPKGHQVRVDVTDLDGKAEANQSTAPDLVEWLMSCPEKGWFEQIGIQGTTADLNNGSFE